MWSRKSWHYSYLKQIQIHLYEVPKVTKFIEKESRMVADRDWGEEVWKAITMDEEFVLQDENFCLSAAQQCEYS